MRHFSGKRIAHQWLQLAVVACLCLGATGCRHKTKTAPPPLLPPPSTVPLVPAPELSTPPQVPPIAVKPLPTPPARPAPKKKKKKPAAPAAPAPVPAPVDIPASPPPGNVVGALSAGGDAAPAAQQKAAGSIADLEKRLAGLPPATLVAQKDAIARVRNFLRQAQDALKSGDSGGASTLADKAKVLLDDLLK